MVQRRGPSSLSSWLPPMICAAAFVAPIVVVVALSLGPFGVMIPPEFAVAPPDGAQKAGEILSDLANVMTTMAVGLIIASAWLYRQPLRPSLRTLHVAVFCASALLSLVSIYSGLRFRYDLAQQLRYTQFVFEPIADRMLWQGNALLLQTSVLCLAAALHFFYRDRRSSPGGAS